jgi:Fe2+ or Zn2+ uptake regulation protein
MKDRMGTRHADAALIEALRERGHRVTPQRVLIHRALQELGRHATADEVMEAVGDRLPNLSAPTVYATLDLLGQLGVVRRISPGEGPVLYDPRADEHHHLVCSRCGRVQDVEARVDTKAAVAAAKRHGFTPTYADVVVSGLCAACAAS